MEIAGVKFNHSFGSRDHDGGWKGHREGEAAEPQTRDLEPLPNATLLPQYPHFAANCAAPSSSIA